jgi:hypothetical protein
MCKHDRSRQKSASRRQEMRRHLLLHCVLHASIPLHPLRRWVCHKQLGHRNSFEISWPSTAQWRSWDIRTTNPRTATCSLEARDTFRVQSAGHRQRAIHWPTGAVLVGCIDKCRNMCCRVCLCVCEHVRIVALRACGNNALVSTAYKASCSGWGYGWRERGARVRGAP